MKMFFVPPDNQLSYHSIPRNSALGLTINNTCDFPSRVLVVDRHGYCFVCACEAWLPVTVGHILEFDKLDDVWQNPVAQELQNDIDQKKFSHCAVDRCGVLNHNQHSLDYCGKRGIVDDSYYISINIDDSCNLQCPSCRNDMTMVTRGADFDHRLSMVNHLVDMLEKFDKPVHLVMSGNGDPLASNIMRPLLHRWRPGANQTIRLFTNGLLLKKQLDDNPIINSITQYFISIDAGSARVYEHVRQPGRFSTLLENFDYLAQLVKQTQAHVLLKFVLQAANYDDMENFVNLCQQYQFNGVINRLENWGTWSDFDQQDVIGNINHPCHTAAMTALRQVYHRHNDKIQFNASLARLANE